MTDKHMPQFCKANTRTAQLDLRTLATINHEQFSTHFYHLRRSIMMQRRQSASAPQDMYSKRFQIYSS